MNYQKSYKLVYLLVVAYFLIFYHLSFFNQFLRRIITSLYVSSSSFFNNIEDGPIYLFKSNKASAVNLILLLNHFNNIYFLLILGANVSKILTKFVKKNLKILTGKIINLLKK
jgi:hypothetical protein